MDKKAIVEMLETFKAHLAEDMQERAKQEREEVAQLSERVYADTRDLIKDGESDE